jgi:hypothetical protein
MRIHLSLATASGRKNTPLTLENGHQSVGCKAPSHCTVTLKISLLDITFGFFAGRPEVGAMQRALHPTLARLRFALQGQNFDSEANIVNIAVQPQSAGI